MTTESQLTWDTLVVRQVAEGAGDPLDLDDPRVGERLSPSVLPLLAAIDPSTLDPATRVDLVRGFERVKAMVEGLQQSALAAVVDATEALGLDGEQARHEVGAALRLAPVTAAERTRVAAELRDRLPDTLAALCRGDISWRQAAHLAEGVRDLSDDLAAAVQARVLPRMEAQTPAETRRAVRDVVVAVDPAGAAERAERARRDRRIVRMPLAGSMASWWFTMPAGVEQDMWSALTARARAAKLVRRAAGLDDEGLDALRVDSLIDAILGAGVATEVTTAHADPMPHVDDEPSDDERADDESDAALPDHALPYHAQRHSRAVPRCSCGGGQVAAVVLDLPTALGLVDNPGHLTGYGAIPGPMARQLAADRDWVRWTRDPGTRHVIDRSASTYRPSERLRALVCARDRVCGFSGCNQPAQDCDLDHVVVFGLRGTTVSVNLGPLCRQHHNAKTHGRWRLHYDAKTHTKTWTSPLGRTYVKTSTPLLV